MSGIGNKEIFAKNLSYYISRSGRDQKEIAEAVGVAPSTFNEWVKGKKYPRINRIELLANYFGILKSDLIEDKKEKSPDQVQLAEGEKLMLELFNQLSEDKQRLVIEMARAVVKTKE